MLFSGHNQMQISCNVYLPGKLQLKLWEHPLERFSSLQGSQIILL